jgi:NTP pyrophosphatase (non-canonical NTP hydrolase)
MTSLNDYQKEAFATAIYPDPYAIIYPAMGLAGEAGEVLNKLKKSLRDGTPIDADGIKKELGDVLWYVAVLAEDLGLSLELVAQDNLGKLRDRAKRGTLRGSGDNR